jgi:hypothetical protein
MRVCSMEVLRRGRLFRVGRIDGEGYQFVEDPEAALGELRRSRDRVDLFTFIQKLSETSPRYGYPLEWDNFAAMPVSTYDHWLSHQINFKVRNKVRKAAKNGVVVREVPFNDALITGICAIYNECPVRQGRRFWHYGEDFETVRRIKATFLERSIFIGAFLQSDLIGFAKLVANEDWSQAGLMHILSMIQHQDKAPTNALIAQAVRSCAERRIAHLWYANFSYGKRQRDSLADFKLHNGFQRVDVPRYYVPLTAKGRMALRLGLHHNTIDRIPAPLAVAYRTVRSLWYARKSPGFEGA